MRRCSWPLLLGALFLLSLAWGLQAGSMPISWGQLLDTVLGQGQPTQQAVVLKLRLPRLLLAAMVGANLSVAGGALQAVLRNPLADPYILGVSGGAGLGAVTALAWGAGNSMWLPVSAFGGALGALLVVYAIAGGRNGSSTTLILAGVMVGSLASAVLLFVLWLAPADPLRQAIFWLTGNLAGARLEPLPWLGCVSLAAMLWLWRLAPGLDILTQGEDVAADLGLEVGRVRLQILVLAGAVTALAVAMAGLIGFVGLVVPHAVRLLWGASYRALLPASALLGASFLMTADSLARTLLAPQQMPVGVITALVGAPLFLWLLRRREMGL